MAKPIFMAMLENYVTEAYVNQAILAALNGKDFTGDTYTRGQVDSLLNLKASSDHVHTNIYTMTETDELLKGKAGLIHQHEDYINREDLASLDKSDLGGILTGEQLNGTQIIYRGGTAQEHDEGEGFIGAPKEITVDTTNWTLRVHDGVTKGGHKLATISTNPTTKQYISNNVGILNGYDFSKLLTDDDTKSYTKTEINNILKAFMNDLVVLIGGE